MATASHRTLMCSVVFLDVVGYSRKSVSDQMVLKERFNAELSNALARVAPADRLVLDTGDGAAITFFCNPELALFVAADLNRRFVSHHDDGAPLEVRIGINLGPAMLVKDVNGQPNVVGDGINVAQRVMSFAQPGTVLVSRSFYEVVSRLADDFAAVFRYEGTRTDKHVREHDVYAVGDTQPLEAQYGDSLSAKATRAIFGIRVPLGVLTILLGASIVTAGAAMRRDIVPPATTVAPAVVAPTPASVAKPEPPVIVAAPPVAPKTAEEKADAAAPDAQVRLVVLPWGEVWLDGKVQGISPPLKTLTLPPGRHTVEVRNEHFPPFAQTVEAQAGGIITLRHKFE